MRSSRFRRHRRRARRGRLRRRRRRHARPHRRGLRRGQRRPGGPAAGAARPAQPRRPRPRARLRGLDGADAAEPCARAARSKGAWGYGVETSKGKDTPSGHWEIAGVPVAFDWGYFPDTQPDLSGRPDGGADREGGLPGILGDKHASGTAIIDELGAEHVRTGKPIFYTSVDSVLQIAAHEEAFGLERLYDLCRIARAPLRPATGSAASSRGPSSARRRPASRAPATARISRRRRPPTRSSTLWRRPAAPSSRSARSATSSPIAAPGAEVKPHGNDACLAAALDALPDSARRRLRLRQPRRFRQRVRPSPRRAGLRRRARSLRPHACRRSRGAPARATSPSSPPTTATTRPGAAPTTPASTSPILAFGPASRRARSGGATPSPTSARRSRAHLDVRRPRADDLALPATGTMRSAPCPFLASTQRRTAPPRPRCARRTIVTASSCRRVQVRSGMRRPAAQDARARRGVRSLDDHQHLRGGRQPAPRLGPLFPGIRRQDPLLLRERRLRRDRPPHQGQARRA